MNRRSLLDELRVRNQAVQESTDDRGDIENSERLTAGRAEPFAGQGEALT